MAALALFTRIVMEPFGTITDQWQQIIIFIAILSMLVGSLGAIKQTNIKRLIAYSSIGHVGYMLVAIAAANESGIKAILVYMSIYAVMSVGLFACILMLKGKKGFSEDIYSLAGLSRNRPLLAIAISIIMFSMAGIPPFTGFLGKFLVFASAVESNLMFLAVIGVLSSVIAAFYYLRVVKICLLYTSDAADES